MENETTESPFESLRDLAKSCAGPHGTIKVLLLSHDSAGGFAGVAMTSNCKRLLEHNELLTRAPEAQILFEV